MYPIPLEHIFKLNISLAIETVFNDGLKVIMKFIK